MEPIDLYYLKCERYIYTFVLEEPLVLHAFFSLILFVWPASYYAIIFQEYCILILSR